MATTILLTGLGLFVLLLACKGKGTLHEFLYPDLYRSVDFPEGRFPARDAAGFREKTRRGYERMKGISLVICGIARNDGETLPRTIRRLEKTGRLFRDYRVVVFENDSTDRTPALLRQWEAENDRVMILSESLLDLPVLSSGRFPLLAYCRNRYLDYLKGSRDLGGFEYVMVVDMDLKGGWSLDGLASSFAETGWDAMAANSIGYHNLRRTYYDKLALQPQSVLKTGLFYRLCGEGWQFRRNGPLAPVRSAFGGLCLYRREALLSRRYSGSFGGRETCEHQALNADGTWRFYLNPSQITVTGSQEAKGYSEKPAWQRSLFLLLRNW